MHTRLHWIATALFAALLISACGGGGGAESPQAPTPDVPDEALASSSSYTEWAKSLRVTESSEPLSMERLVEAPSSETDEPVALN